MTSEEARNAKIVSFVLALVLSSTGCTVTLRNVPLDAPERTYSDTVAAEGSSDGITGMIGWGRLSLFYIPVVPIFIVNDTQPSQSNTRAQIANREVMKQVHRALRHVGYQVDVVDSGAPSEGPILVCEVEKFWFNNYTWLAPFVPTWGSAKLNTKLESSDGNTLWSGSFEGSGFSANFFEGYTSAVNKAMEEILNEMVRSFSSEEFHRALTGRI